MRHFRTGRDGFWKRENEYPLLCMVKWRNPSKFLCDALTSMTHHCIEVIILPEITINDL
jgi:hypothetical protein